MKKVRKTQLNCTTNSGKQWFQSLYIKATYNTEMDFYGLVIDHLEQYPTTGMVTECAKADIVDGICALLQRMKPKETDWLDEAWQ